MKQYKDEFSYKLYEILARLSTDPKRGVYTHNACNDADIDRLRFDSRDKLGEEIPEAYLKFLKVTNGAQINGSFFKEAENIVPENLDMYRPEVIVLGVEGNMAEYVFDRRDRRFHVINMGYVNERFDSFETFEEMLLNVMSQ